MYSTVDSVACTKEARGQCLMQLRKRNIELYNDFCQHFSEKCQIYLKQKEGMSGHDENLFIKLADLR